MGAYGQGRASALVTGFDDVEMRAHAAWEAGQPRRALRLFAQGAGDGIVGCVLMLGYFHDEGIGTRVDKAKAMSLYRRAWRRGYLGAASNIAILYREQGRHRMEFAWFDRAARMGDGDAEVELAKLLLAGRGIPASVRQAAKHLRAALRSELITEAGREEAKKLLSGSVFSK
jgi:TPR repeat protein